MSKTAAPSTPAAPLWLGLDVGTGGTRALLVNATGEVVAAASAAHAPVAMPQPLWAEQDANDWWRAAQTAIREVLRSARAEEIQAIGLSGQMHGVALLDARDEALGTSLIWCDQRTQPQVDRLTAAIGAEEIIRRTANPLLTGFSAPKLAWLRENRAADWRRATGFVLPKDFARLRLTGERATDVADASGTGLFDVVHRRWSAAMLDSLELPPTFVPRACEGPEVTGHVTAAAAQATGLRAGTPVVAGGGDQAAGAVGNGIVAPGLASATVGTSGVLFAATAKPLVDARGRIHTFCHSVPGVWHVMGVTQGAGLSLRWVRDQLGAADGAEGDAAYESLCREAAEGSSPGAGGVLFLPYLMGERTPHLDALARGGWIGVTAASTRADLVRSVLEGVAFSLRDSLVIFAGLGLRPSEIRLSGGGARGEVWPRIQADVYGAPCARLANTEGAAYGAAVLAMVGTGLFPSVAAACERCLRVETRFAPNAALSEIYDRAYEVYAALYPRLKDLFPPLSRLAAAPLARSNGV